MRIRPEPDPHHCLQQTLNCSWRLCCIKIVYTKLKIHGTDENWTGYNSKKFKNFNAKIIHFFRRSLGSCWTRENYEKICSDFLRIRSGNPSPVIETWMLHHAKLSQEKHIYIYIYIYIGIERETRVRPDIPFLIYHYPAQP